MFKLEHSKIDFLNILQALNKKVKDFRNITNE